jgi:hypothetical protein
MEVAKTAKHLGLTQEQTQSASYYYEAYPAEIDIALTENDSLGYEQIKRLLPNAQLSVIAPSHSEEPL